MRQPKCRGIIRIVGHLRREEVKARMHYIITFILAVLAGVAVHIIVKWLDSKKK